jgi:hypothetical protein
LLSTGFLYRVFQATGSQRGEIYLVPDELRPLVRGANQPPSAAPPPVAPPTEGLACQPVFSLFAMASFIRRWRYGHLADSGEGQLVALARETAELTRELPGRLPRERWTLLAHLGLRLGLFSREEGGLHPTDRIEDWLADPAAAHRSLWEGYLTADQWNDLERAGTRSERFAGHTAAPISARAELLDLLRSLPADQWVLATEVERFVRQRSPDFLREGFDASTARLVDLESGEVFGGADSWARVEAPLLHYMLSGPLFWLGVVEWGLADEWDRIRLTPAGRAWLLGGDQILQPAQELCHFVDECRLSAPEGTDLGSLWRLEPYLALERRGPTSVYALNRGSFTRGLEGGGSSLDLKQLLERVCGGELPLSITVALERWRARVGRFRIRPLVVLSADDLDEFERALGHKDIAPHVKERLGPLAVVVLAARAPEIAERLSRLGHIPETDGALRLMAGRRAYPALVDQHALEALLFCLRFIKALKPALLAGIPEADRLVQRLEQALGPIAAPRLGRRARAEARKLRGDLPASRD